MNDINKKILIIEDEESFLSILQKIFSSEGFSVVTAKDGEGGIRMAEKEKPDLIISDMLLPKMDGLTMAKKIRELKIESPIIFLTNVGEQDRDDKEFDYFTKSEMSIDDIAQKAKEKLGIK
jgi:two-component system alkaline phosphatase synthesis response regulator PhoP